MEHGAGYRNIIRIRGESVPVCVCVCWGTRREREAIARRRCSVIRYYLENHVITIKASRLVFSRFTAIVCLSVVCFTGFSLCPATSSHAIGTERDPQHLVAVVVTEWKRERAEVVHRIWGWKGCSIRTRERECPYALWAISLDQFCCYITTASTADSD